MREQSKGGFASERELECCCFFYGERESWKEGRRKRRAASCARPGLGIFFVLFCFVLFCFVLSLSCSSAMVAAAARVVQ